MKIYIISDTHFGHLNMIPYCGRPKDFDDVIIKNWNKIVRPEDLVIHLGDVIMGPGAQERLPSIMATLPGKKILCRGNHDVEKAWGTNIAFMESGFDFVCDYFVYDKYAFSHCPLTPLPMQANGNWDKLVDLCFHGHFHNNEFGESKSGKSNGKDRFYNTQEYLMNKDSYKLVQIEDELRPFSLEELLREGV